MDKENQGGTFKRKLSKREKKEQKKKEKEKKITEAGSAADDCTRTCPIQGSLVASQIPRP